MFQCVLTGFRRFHKHSAAFQGFLGVFQGVLGVSVNFSEFQRSHGRSMQFQRRSRKL